MTSNRNLRLIDTAAAAELLDVPSSTLVYWRSVEQGPPYLRIGRLCKYERSVLIDWALDHLVTPRSMDSMRSRAMHIEPFEVNDGLY